MNLAADELSCMPTCFVALCDGVTLVSTYTAPGGAAAPPVDIFLFEKSGIISGGRPSPPGAVYVDIFFSPMKVPALKKSSLGNGAILYAACKTYLAVSAIMLKARWHFA